MKYLLILAVLCAPLAFGQATGNTTIQPDCLIPFTLSAAGNSPATNVANAANDNRTKGCAAWTLMYQSTGLTMVTVTLQSGCSTSTTVSYGTFAGDIPTSPMSNANPIVSDTGGELTAINGTACISWVRVNVAATGTGTLTGVLYGFRNSSSAVNSGGGSSLTPCGPTVGEVQLFASSSALGCDPAFVGDTVDHLFKISGSPITPFAGLYVGPDESTLPAFLQEYFTGTTVLVSTVDASLAIENTTGNGIGVAVTSSGGFLTGIEVDNIVNAAGTQAINFYNSLVVQNNANLAFGANYYATAPFADMGSVITTFVSYWSAALGGTATNDYSFWADEQGVFRIRSDNTFNSVYQAIPALYDPQFTKYTPGTPNYSRLVLGEWNSEISEVGNYAGGTGTPRDFRLLGPTVHVGVASNIGSTTFTGSGTNDGLFAGTYTGATATYCAIIQTSATSDTFEWGTNGGCNNGATGVVITGAEQALSNGAAIVFATTTGHTVADKWSVVAIAASDLWQFQSATNDLQATESVAGAVAPGASKAALRWLAGTVPGTCKLVSNAGTSATEVTIIDNVGSGGC